LPGPQSTNLGLCGSEVVKSKKSNFSFDYTTALQPACQPEALRFGANQEEGAALPSLSEIIEMRAILAGFRLIVGMYREGNREALVIMR
jgi:hypothetical protein